MCEATGQERPAGRAWGVISFRLFSLDEQRKWTRGALTGQRYITPHRGGKRNSLALAARCTGCTSVAEARDDAQEVQVSREHMDVRSDRPRATSENPLQIKSAQTIVITYFYTMIG